MEHSIYYLLKMIGKIITVLLLCQCSMTEAGAQTSGSKSRNYNIGLIYPLSTNGRRADTCTNDLSLHAIAGLSKAERGLVLAGMVNVVLDTAAGLQVGGFANVLGSSRGTSIAGFGNICRRDASGVQVAGFVNTAANAGVQVGGFVNRSADVTTQVAGFINVAKKVRGVQIAGFINIADSSDNPIAIFNFIKKGELSVGVSTDETLTTLASFRSGGRNLYGIAGIGYNHKGRRELAAWEAGLGAHLLSGPYFRLNIELVTGGLTDFKNGDLLRSTLRVLPACHLTRRLELFAGPDFNYFYSNKGQGIDLRSHYLWNKTKNNSDSYGLYFGFTAGVAVRI